MHCAHTCFGVWHPYQRSGVMARVWRAGRGRGAWPQPQLAAAFCLLAGSGGSGVSAAEEGSSSATAIDQITEVILYTKVAPPFSSKCGMWCQQDGCAPKCKYPSSAVSPAAVAGEQHAHGYTIDYVHKMLSSIRVSSGAQARSPQGGHWDTIVSVRVLGSNPEIFTALNETYCNAVAHPQRLCLGAAAISMTPSRERDLGNFHPTFIRDLSGLQVLMHEPPKKGTLDYLEIGFSFFGGLMIILGSLILVIAPIVWLLETTFSGGVLFSDPGSPSIFHATDGFLLDLLPPDQPIVVSEFLRTAWEMFNALLWTATLLFIGYAGRPASYPVLFIRGVILVLQKMLILLLVAGSAALLTTLGLQDDSGNSYDELVDKTVCTVEGTSSHEYITTKNPGFSVLVLPTLQAMFAAFWRVECEATVYDAPLLAYELLQRREYCAANGCEVKASLVGSILNYDHYGLMVPSSTSPALQEVLRVTSLSVMSQSDFTDQIFVLWFGALEQDGLDKHGSSADELIGTGLTDKVWGSWLWWPIGLMAALYAIGGLFFHFRQEALRDKHLHDQYLHDTNDFNYLLYNIARKGKADIQTLSDTDLIHEMAGEMRDVKKLILNQMLHTREQERLNLAEMRSKYGIGGDLKKIVRHLDDSAAGMATKQPQVAFSGAVRKRSTTNTDRDAAASLPERTSTPSRGGAAVWVESDATVEGVFAGYDLDQDGYLSEDELIGLLHDIGYTTISHGDDYVLGLMDIFGRFDLGQKTGMVSKSEFAKLWTHLGGEALDGGSADHDDDNHDDDGDDGEENEEEDDGVAWGTAFDIEEVPAASASSKFAPRSGTNGKRVASTRKDEYQNQELEEKEGEVGNRWRGEEEDAELAGGSSATVNGRHRAASGTSTRSLPPPLPQPSRAVALGSTRAQQGRLGSLQGELSRGTPAAATPTTTANPLSSWGSDGEIRGAIPRGMAPQPSPRPKMGNAGGSRPGRSGVSVKDGYGRAENIEHVV